MYDWTNRYQRLIAYDKINDAWLKHLKFSHDQNCTNHHAKPIHHNFFIYLVIYSNNILHEKHHMIWQTKYLHLFLLHILFHRFQTHLRIVLLEFAFWEINESSSNYWVVIQQLKIIIHLLVFILRASELMLNKTTHEGIILIECPHFASNASNLWFIKIQTLHGWLSIIAETRIIRGVLCHENNSMISAEQLKTAQRKWK